jgi:hypothetical protein
MKILILSLATALILLIGCKPTERIIYRTVEVPRIEICKDSVLVHRTDSFVQIIKGDTVYFETFKTMYKDRISIKVDTVTNVVEVPVPYDVEKIKYKWNWLSWVGLSVLIAGAGWLVLWIRKLLP